MIGKIYGIFDSSYTDVALIRTQDGLCYEVALKNTEIDKLEPNHNVCFYIKQIFKEDSVILYGFSTFEEKCWFESLTKLDGLGPRTALAILSTFSVDSIHSAIVLKNDEFFIAVPGIGKKIASRIINEMQTSLSKINAKILSHKNLEFNETCKEVKKNSNLTHSLNKATEETAKINKDSEMTTKASILNDATQALIKLGFQANNAYQKAHKILQDNPEFKIEDIIKDFLRN